MRQQPSVYLRNCPKNCAAKIAPDGWRKRFTGECGKSFSANRLRIFASTLRTATEIVRTQKKTSTRNLPLRKRRVGCKKARFRPSSVSASNHFHRNYATAASARSTFLSARCARRHTAGFLKTLSSHCRK